MAAASAPARAPREPAAALPDAPEGPGPPDRLSDAIAAFAGGEEALATRPRLCGPEAARRNLLAR